MSDEPVIESTAVEVIAAPAQLAVVPNVGADDLVQRLAVIREAMETAMVEDIDYGVIPGAKKPSLFKPGAEKLGVLFQFDIQIVNEKTWGPDDHLTVVSHATVFHAPTQTRMGYGEGICTTREKKYAKRTSERVCPVCSAPAIIKGKAEYGGGWLCWAKKAGCGAKFRDDEPSITEQTVGEIDNPEIPDLWNTVDKMASKRARVDAVLAVTGASALFTQDLEDLEHASPAPPPAAERPSDIPSDLPVLNEDQEQRVVASIEDAGRDVEEVYAEVGAVAGCVTLELAHAIKALIAGESLDKLADEVFGATK